jgi:hypothetical protein
VERCVRQRFRRRAGAQIDSFLRQKRLLRSLSRSHLFAGRTIGAALDAVALLLLQDHTAHCVVEAIEAGDGSQKVRELNEAVARLVKGR